MRSIAAQSLCPDELVICDDRSCDQTARIIEECSQTLPFPIRYMVNSERMGVVRNFEQAIGMCRGRYIALADQDDVWLPDKLENQLAVIRQLETEVGADTPILVHSDLVIVDESLRPIYPSMLRALRLHKDSNDSIRVLLVQNSVTGCATMINRPLIESALPFSEHAVMHDWWLAICAAAYGEVRTILMPTVLYRQHGGNQVGAGRYWGLVAARLRSLFGGAGHAGGKTVPFERKVAQAKALAAQMAAGPPGAVSAGRGLVVEHFAAAFAPDIGRWRRLWRVVQSGVAPRTLLLRIRFLVQVLTWSPAIRGASPGARASRE